MSKYSDLVAMHTRAWEQSQKTRRGCEGFVNSVIESLMADLEVPESGWAYADINAPATKRSLWACQRRVGLEKMARLPSDSLSGSESRLILWPQSCSCCVPRRRRSAGAWESTRAPGK